MRIGDFLPWDDRYIGSGGDAFDRSARRVMHRTQIKGGQRPQPGLVAA